MIRGWFTIAYQPDQQPKWDAIREKLMDRSRPSNQADALKQLVLLSYSETIPPHLLMPIIQYTATTNDHRVIKLLLIFLENCDTRDSTGKMRPEFLLIIDAIRKLLLHPNEYIRGAALRFLYKVNDIEVLQQLLTPILNNLTHNDEYVRRHAAILVGRIARDIPSFIDSVSDSIIEAFSTEADQRTLTAMLYSAYQANPLKAADFTINMKQFFSNVMKLAILNVSINTYRNYPQFRGKFLETVVDFCEDESIAVRLQSAFVLRNLSNSPAAVRTTTATYCDLLNLTVDENLRSFVVQELIEMIESNRTIMAPFALEMAQGTSVTGHLKVKLLTELVNLVTEENSAALVPLITYKDINSLESLKTLLLRFPQTVAAPIAEQMGSFVSDSDLKIAEPSTILLKDCGIAGAKKEAYRIFLSAIQLSPFISVLSRAIWSIAEFCDDINDAADLLSDFANFTEDTKQQVSKSANTIVSEDGTYVTKTQPVNEQPNLKSMLQKGDSYLALSLVSALIKFKLRGSTVNNIDQVVNCILGFPGIEKNARDICNLWLSVASTKSISNLLEKSSRDSFYERSMSLKTPKVEEVKIVEADEPLQFSVLLGQTDSVPETKTEVTTLPIFQVTGPSDSIYVEVDCSLRKFDRVYHFYVYNRTNSTLTNILFEFTPIGNVSILQRNDLMSLAPNQKGTFDLPVMISSSSCGTLFGAVSFDFAGASGNDHQLLPLSPIEIDPFYCFEATPISQPSFREKWSESVWERKIDITTEETDLLKYLDHISSDYHFSVITPMKQLEVTAKYAGFIAANLFTRSIFNDEVEANLSAKIDSTQKITGFIRIRTPDERLAFLFGKLIQ